MTESAPSVAEGTGVQHRNKDGGQGLWEEEGRANSAGLTRQRRRDEPRSEEEKQRLHWVRVGGPACRRELLGQRCSSGKTWFIQKRVSPSAPTMIDATEQEE